MLTERVKEPEEMLLAYYEALYRGKLERVKQLMTWESYVMTLESFGLKLALNDKQFKTDLAKVDIPEVLEKVEAKLSQDLIAREKAPLIEIVSTKWNGPTRKSISYLEDGKEKVLYFSKEKEEWRIDYYAGRKVA